MTIKTAHAASIKPIEVFKTTANWPGYIAAGLLFAVGWLVIHAYAELPTAAQSTLNVTPDRSLELAPKQAAGDPDPTVSIAH